MWLSETKGILVARRNPMRVFYFFVLLLVFIAIGIFAMQNRELITLQYLGESITCPRHLLFAGVYLLGMVSGWTLIGLVRRSYRHATNSPAT
jgi:lipopolysaccharide assembly protein A